MKRKHIIVEYWEAESGQDKMWRLGGLIEMAMERVLEKKREFQKWMKSKERKIIVRYVKKHKMILADFIY